MLGLLSRVNIGLRLILSFTILLVLLGLIAILSLTRISSLTSANEDLVSEDLSHLMLASKADREASAAAINLLTILLTNDRNQRVPLYQAMDRHSGNLDALLNQLHSSDNSDRLLNTALEKRKAYQEALSDTVDLVELDIDDALAQFYETARPALSAFLSSVDNLVQDKQQSLLAEHQQGLIESENAQNTVIFLSIAALLSGIILTVLVSRSITEPISRAVNVAKKIAQGDLRSTEEISGRDEVSTLMEAFNEMIEGLRRHISLIQHSAQNLETSATALAVPVASVETGSKNQSDSVAQIIELVEAFSEEAAIAATTAKNTKNQSDSARKSAIEGEKLIQLATKEFTQISETISGSAKAVEALNERAAAVREMVTTIREIAEQTNLLALNAAIEAARAGESGRGFSVVADEVRGLANRTEQATIEINDVIDAIDKETKSAAFKITHGQTELEQGVSIIQKMVNPLENLKRDAQSSYEELELLEITVKKQAEESTNMQNNIAQIGESASLNFEAAEEVSATTSNLKDISDNLGSLVMEFNLR